jgi:hypothetical protein
MLTGKDPSQRQLSQFKPKEKKEQWIIYKYHEGFANAVKRSVYLRDFLN